MEEERLEQELARFAAAVVAVPEPAMRRERVLTALLERPADEVAELLGHLLRLAPGGPESLALLRGVVLDTLFLGGATRPLPYDRRAEIYAAAAERHDVFLTRLLRSPGAREEMEDPVAALDRATAEIPLGTRRSLARGADRNLLEKLLLDPDALVVEHLLENPRITEVDVVRIAARRPVPASTLQAVARSARFGALPRVRAALARNPFCPTDVALHAMASLSPRELREVVRDVRLHPDTRAHADDELARRSGGGSHD